MIFNGGKFPVELKEGESVDSLLLGGLNIIQKEKTFRYGTDAVLLKDFAEIPAGSSVLDIGTGTGIIPILLTLKTENCHFTAIDVQPDICEMASRSVNMNGLSDVISVKNIDVNKLTERCGKRVFDCVVTNPPYKRRGSGILNDTDGITCARHETLCTIDDIIRVSSEVLKSEGRFFMICRPERLCDIFESMRKYRLEPKTLTFVHSDITKPPVLFMVSAVLFGGKNLKVTAPYVICGNTKF